MLCCHLQHTSPRKIKPVKPPRASRRKRQQFNTFVQRTTLALPATLCTVVPVKPVNRDGFRLQSPESMALEHLPSWCIPEDHYGNDIWSNFNLATELPRIPTPVSSSVNNPHQLTEFQSIRRQRPCHHLLKRKHLTIPCLSMEDITLGGHHARGSLDSCIMPNEHFWSSLQRLSRLVRRCCVWTIILLYTCITTINHSVCIDESLLLFPLLHATIVECSTCL